MPSTRLHISVLPFIWCCCGNSLHFIPLSNQFQFIFHIPLFISLFTPQPPIITYYLTHATQHKKLNLCACLKETKLCQGPKKKTPSRQMPYVLKVRQFICWEFTKLLLQHHILTIFFYSYYWKHLYIVFFFSQNVLQNPVYFYLIYREMAQAKQMCKNSSMLSTNSVLQEMWRIRTVHNVCNDKESLENICSGPHIIQVKKQKLSKQVGVLKPGINATGHTPFQAFF